MQLRREKVRVHFKGPQLAAGTFAVTVLSGKHPTDEIVDLGVACPDKEGLIPKTVEAGLVVKLQFRQYSPVGSRPRLERVHLLNQVENSLGLLEKLKVNGSFSLKEKRSRVKGSRFDHLAEVALSRFAVVGEKGPRQSKEQIGIIGLQLQASLELGSGSTVVVFFQCKLSRREIRLDYAVRDVLSLRFGRLGLPVVFVQHHTGISSKNESGLTKFNVVTRRSFASRHRGGSAIDSGKHLSHLFFTPETSEQLIRSQQSPKNLREQVCRRDRLVHGIIVATDLFKGPETQSPPFPGGLTTTQRVVADLNDKLVTALLKDLANARQVVLVVKALVVRLAKRGSSSNKEGKAHNGSQDGRPEAIGGDHHEQ